MSAARKTDPQGLRSRTSQGATVIEIHRSNFHRIATGVIGLGCCITMGLIARYALWNDETPLGEDPSLVIFGVLAASLGLFSLYQALIAVLNKSVVRISPESVTVRHRPIPRPHLNRDLRMADLNRVQVQLVGPRRHKYFRISAVPKDGRIRRILSVDLAEQARFLQRSFDDYHRKNEARRAAHDRAAHDRAARDRAAHDRPEEGLVEWLPGTEPSSADRDRIATIIAVGAGLLFGIPAVAVLASFLRDPFADRSPADLVMTSVMVLVPLAVGYGIVRLARSRRLRATKEQLKSQFPGEPWKHDPRWLGGTLASGELRAATGLWLVAAFWNLASLPLLIALADVVFRRGNRLAALGFVFPAIGIGLLAWVVVESLRLLRFGESRFEIAGGTGSIGGHLAGTVRGERSFPIRGDYQARLACAERVTIGHGDTTSTERSTLWEDQLEISSEDHDLTEGVPVTFAIPKDCPPSAEAGRHSVVWTLELSAPTPWMRYRATFEVPVFPVCGRPGDHAARDERIDRHGGDAGKLAPTLVTGAS